MEEKQLKYYKMHHDLEKQIHRGELRAGDRVPSENQLAAAYQVSRQTVRKALAILEQEGYIYAIGRQDFLIKHITPHGLSDGYILKKIDSVMHLEISGQYEKKIEKLYSKKNQRHIDLKLQDKVSLKNNIFQICMNNKYIVSIEMIQDDECPIKGVINKIDDNKVIVSKLTEYGEDDGEAILKKENIDTISFLGVDEEDIQLLKRK